MRSWAAVHASTTAFALLTLTGLASLVLASVRITHLGPLHFLSPPSALLLLPAVAGTAVGLACTNQVGLSLPDPARAKGARAAWLVAWCLGALAVANAGQLLGADVSGQAVARNVLLHASLAVLLVVLRFPALAWLPSMLLTMVVILFGGDANGAYYWAVLLRSDITAGQVVTVSVLWSVIGLVHILRAQTSG